jgi:hypothetical protein
MALIDVNGKRFKTFMARLYGLGASVVILGALFKILHWDGADIMLIVGLTTESVIFFSLLGRNRMKNTTGHSFTPN